ncbi:hypothetical protein QMK33_07910 [Hymenobacter sp. H14-R3]|uniref:hypothetical protein n=1 Tax=Hymenobacter sp. H14-R3 TaxID=3046308 RepID=UPI0024BB7BA7|nr:hypothetical protein [Hymenobacter sp. H14-R3]MDJ0365074.1 hypothetical protein [Hymenobacter sp. H14-R3]
MTTNQQTIKVLLQEIASPNPAYYPLQPASQQALATFEQRAIARGVPTGVTQQLVAFYQVANAFFYDSCLGFFTCDDELIFEWWEAKELWLSLMHMDVIRWSGGKFCVGDASNVSYSPAHEHDTLLALLTGCRDEIKEMEAAEPEPGDDF